MISYDKLMGRAVTLSVVIPCKNKEQDIGRCLKSVIDTTAGDKSVEIILVDCCSLDRTIEIAKKFPIKILQLRRGWLHSASAARYIGALYSKGEFILFIDSDMELASGFLIKAKDVLQRDKSIAGLGGIGSEVYYCGGKVTKKKDNLYNSPALQSEVNFLGGAGLYRRQIILEAGGFNPYLKASEEHELAQRIRKSGHKLVSIPFPMIVHHTADLNSWDEFKRKRNMGLFLGIGQAMRLSHSLKYLIESMAYYKEFTLFLVLAFWLPLSFIACVFLSFPKYLYYLACSPFAVIYLILLMKKKSFKESGLSVVKWLIICKEVMRGFIHKPRDPKKYPINALIIKEE